MFTPRLKFRGDRKYLQSASVLNWILREHGASGLDLDFRFSARTGNQVVLSTLRPEIGQRMIGRYSDASTSLFLVESEIPILESEPYAESMLVQKFTGDDKKVIVPGPGDGFTAADITIAGFKFLVERLIPESRGRLAFARMMWKHPPIDESTIQLRRRISGDMYEGSIHSQGNSIGSIIFGEWK